MTLVGSGSCCGVQQDLKYRILSFFVSLASLSKDADWIPFTEVNFESSQPFLEDFILVAFYRQSLSCFYEFRTGLRSCHKQKDCKDSCITSENHDVVVMFSHKLTRIQRHVINAGNLIKIFARVRCVNRSRVLLNACAMWRRFHLYLTFKLININCVEFEDALWEKQFKRLQKGHSRNLFVSWQI